MEKKVTPTEIIDLIESLPGSEWHIHEFDGLQWVTQEWLCGPLAGVAFDGDTTEKAAEKLIDYLYEHIGHNSLVGRSVTASGFPDLEKVKAYCLTVLDEV